MLSPRLFIRDATDFGDLPPTGGLGGDGGAGVARRVGDPRPLPPEQAPQDAALQGLQQGALAHSLVPEQLELDPGLQQLAGTQLLDVAQLVVVLGRETQPC